MTLFRSEGANYDETAGEGTLPSDVRRGYQGLFTSTGVLASSDSPLVEGAGDFTYTVHTGYWVTSRGGSDGFHYWGNLGDYSVPTSVAPAAGLSRIDIIYALHPSAGENGDDTSEPIVDVEQGVEASSPVAPSLPVGALELARNTMTSAATSTSSDGNTIEQTAPAAGLVGGGSLATAAVEPQPGLASTGVARRQFGQVSFTGALSLSAPSLTFANAFTHLGTLPPGFRPTEATLLAVMTSSGRPVQAQVGSNGLIYVRSTTGDVTITTGQSLPLTQFGPFPVGAA